MITEKYITGSVAVSNGTVTKDGVGLFRNENSRPASFFPSVYQHFQLNYPKFYKMDNLGKLGWLAAELLLKDGFQKDKYQPEEVGLILANANSSLDDDIKYLESTKDIASPSLFVYTLPNIVIGEICIRNNFKGEHAFFIRDSFDAAFMEKQVSYLLDNAILKTCICGWVEVIDESYKAVLFLIEKEKTGVAVVLSAGEMEDIFNRQ